MKLYIPEIGDELCLAADWTFPLYNEDRNHSLMKYLRDPREFRYSWNSKDQPLPATIPAGAILKVDRVYIRKGQKDFSSITFFWKGAANPGYTEPSMTWDRNLQKRVPDGGTVRYPKEAVRFWAKLEDVNKMEIEPV